MTEIMTPAAFAETVNSDSRTVRKFLRSITPKEEQPGKGARWSLPTTKRELNKLARQFNDWTAAQAKPEPAPEAEVETDEVDSDIEPTDEELLELDD